MDFGLALFGGIIIGFSASLFLLFNGRISGISGMFHSLSDKNNSLKIESTLFIIGLIFSGLLAGFVKPQLFDNSVITPFWKIALAGFLVGLGTKIGNGCTSGHGVCGISRGSVRSIFATLTFMISGIISVAIIRIF